MRKCEEITKEYIVELLAREDFSDIYEEASMLRAAHVGDEIRLRAIIEFSNICKRKCLYCGLNCNNGKLPRYRMSAEEIIETANRAIQEGYRTIVLQSGEDDGYSKKAIGDIIRKIKEITFSERCPNCRTVAAMKPAVTLSVGERPYEDYAYWRECGCDRYLLKHETADEKLYDKLHPDASPNGLEKRLEALRQLKSLGYEIGSGFMVGLPQQTLEDLADNLLLLRRLNCDMAGIGPYIYNPKTGMKDAFGELGVSFDVREMTKRCIAMARILLPEINLPTTTAARVLGEKTSEIRDYGANVIMDKFTPAKYREIYEIYPEGEECG